MTQRNDMVFQLSLSEIAFTISFLLLLLLGYLVFREQTGREAAEAALAEAQSNERAAFAELHAIKSALSPGLQRDGGPSPDEIITELVAAGEIRADRDRLRQRVADLDAGLTALTELQRQAQTAAQARRPEIESALSLQEQVRSLMEDDADASLQAAGPKGTDAHLPDRVKSALATALELKKQLKAQLDKELAPGREAQTIQDVVAAARSYSDLAGSPGGSGHVKRENADLRGQVAFLKNRLEARGGRDYPPCWADEKTGKVEFLFFVEVKPNSVIVEPAWPPNRDADARALPGIERILSDSPHSNPNFVRRIQGIFNKSRECQCRHFVRLKSTIDNAVQSDRSRLMVENYFYKSEVRR